MMEFWRTSEMRALRQMEGRDATTIAAALGRSVDDIDLAAMGLAA